MTGIQAMLAEREALLRQREILADIAFQSGSEWIFLNADIRTALMEELEGSRGLKDKLYEWAVKFDAFWETLPENDPRREDYITEIDTFAREQMAGLVATVRLEM